MRTPWWFKAWFLFVVLMALLMVGYTITHHPECMVSHCVTVLNP